MRESQPLPSWASKHPILSRILTELLENKAELEVRGITEEQIQILNRKRHYLLKCVIDEAVFHHNTLIGDIRKFIRDNTPNGPLTRDIEPDVQIDLPDVDPPPRRRPVQVSTDFDIVVKEDSYFVKSESKQYPSYNPMKTAVEKYGKPGVELRIGIDGDYKRTLRVGYSNQDPRFDDDLIALKYEYNGQPMHLFIGAVDNTANVKNIMFGETSNKIGSLTLHNLCAHAPYQDARCVQGYTDISGQVTLDGVEFAAAPGVNRIEHGFYMEYYVPELTIKNRRNSISTWSNKEVVIYHHLNYIKGLGKLNILNNVLTSTAGRTALQYRPQAIPQYGSPAGKGPSGDITITGNYCKDGGWNSQYPQGGSRITIYGNPDYTTTIKDNVIVNERFGGIALSYQKNNEHGNFLNQGYTHNKVTLDSNKINNINGDRPAVLLSAIKELILQGKMEIETANVPILINGPWELGDSLCPEMSLRNIKIDGIQAYTDYQNLLYMNNRNKPYNLITDSDYSKLYA